MQIPCLPHSAIDRLSRVCVNTAIQGCPWGMVEPLCHTVPSPSPHMVLGSCPQRLALGPHVVPGSCHTVPGPPIQVSHLVPSSRQTHVVFLPQPRLHKSSGSLNHSDHQAGTRARAEPRTQVFAPEETSCGTALGPGLQTPTPCTQGQSQDMTDPSGRPLGTQEMDQDLPQCLRAACHLSLHRLPATGHSRIQLHQKPNPLGRSVYLCLEGSLLALFSSSSRRLRASSSCVKGLGAGLGGIVGSWTKR